VADNAYSPEEYVAVQDINSGLEYLGIMGWDSLLWEWKVCQEERREKGRIDIFYRYDGDGDERHIYYDRMPKHERILIQTLEAIIETCTTAGGCGESPAEFAERIEGMALKALNDYERGRVQCP
jgi:hypothetical protein